MNLTHQDVLAAAAHRVGLEAVDAKPLSISENATYLLPGGIVVRIARPGQAPAARREIAVSRWLASNGIPAVRTYDRLEQPVIIEDRAVSFWEELPKHRNGNPDEIAVALRRLHALPIPSELDLPHLDPFAKLDARIEAATSLPEQDRAWLADHLSELRHQYDHLPAGLPACVIHGDAWGGNVVVAPADGTILLLDLERSSVGPPEWDLVSTAIKHSSFGWTTERQYDEFVEAYGYDVTTWAGFELLRDIRELRMTCYASQQAGEHPRLRDEAATRVASLRGRFGSRPWPWSPAL